MNMETDDVVALTDGIRLAPSVEAVLEAVDIASAGLSARVGERSVEVDSVRALWPALSTALYETTWTSSTTLERRSRII